MNDDELAAISALAEAATDGPWFVVTTPWLEDAVPYVNAGSPDPHHDGFVCDLENMATPDAPRNAQSDAEFIVAARTAVPALVAALAEAHRTLADVEAERDEAVQKLASLREHTLDSNPALRALHEQAVLYRNAVEAYGEVHGPLSTTLEWVIRYGSLSSRSGAESGETR